MSYLVLARKYRPQTFDEVVGQRHITEGLKSAVTTGRMGHAFLFCGPRGVGKTSLARILAKSLNCQSGPTLTPCGACFACQEIASSNSFDVIEIDGASNRGIDEIRTLRENVKFAPSYGRYKIYIVDEVHMLTAEAFNALLKTLEEPPEYVKFILATTESHKVPATIISRCQRFDFKRIPADEILTDLKDICGKEGLKVKDDALFAIARAAQGSLRDALSILDQVGAVAASEVSAAEVFSMLGLVETELVFTLCDALLARETAKALEIFHSILDKGKDIKQLNKDLIEHYRHLMIMKVGGASLQGLVDYPAVYKERLYKQSQTVDLSLILRAMDILIRSQETGRVMESARLALEMAFMELTYQGQGQAVGVKSTPAPSPAPVKRPSAAPVASPAPVKPAMAPQVPVAVVKVAQAASPAPAPAPEVASAVGTVASDLSLEEIKSAWHSLTHEVSRAKMSLAAYLQEASPYAFTDGRLTLSLSADNSFHKECLEDVDSRKYIEDVFSQKLGTSIRLDFILLQVEHKRSEEPVVKNVLDAFKGKVVREWYNE